MIINESINNFIIINMYKWHSDSEQQVVYTLLFHVGFEPTTRTTAVASDNYTTHIYYYKFGRDEYGHSTDDNNL